MCLERYLETGFAAIKWALLLLPHSVGLFPSMAKSVHNFFSHVSPFAVALIPISSDSVWSPAMMSCLSDLRNTQLPCIISMLLDTLFRLSAFAESASEYATVTMYPLGRTRLYHEFAFLSQCLEYACFDTNSILDQNMF